MQAAESLNVPLPLDEPGAWSLHQCAASGYEERIGPPCRSCLPKRPSYDASRMRVALPK